MYANGSIIIYELPTFSPHGAAAGELFYLLKNQFGAQCGGSQGSLFTCIPDDFIWE